MYGESIKRANDAKFCFANAFRVWRLETMLHVNGNVLVATRRRPPELSPGLSKYWEKIYLGKVTVALNTQPTVGNPRRRY